LIVSKQKKRVLELDLGLEAFLANNFGYRLEERAH
jgi:hypothetical protein